MNAIPPNVVIERKYYVGFYDGNKLLAVLDLIDGYPTTSTASECVLLAERDL